MFKRELKDRLAERDAANAPWDREQGKREKLTVCLPYDNQMEWVEIESAFNWLEIDLTIVFGGFTRQQMVGGWKDDKLKTELGLEEYYTEHGYIYSVSYVPSAGNRERAIKSFEATAKALKQTWLHIERSEFQAEHRKVG